MSRFADPELAERRRRQILDAAAACFCRRGFHQATMQEICAEAGISPGALYRYFGSKTEIIAAIAEDEHARSLLAAEEFGDAANDSLVDRVCRAAQTFYEKAMGGEGATLVADVLAEVARDPFLARSLNKLDERRIERFASWIHDAQATGEVDPTLDPHAAALTLAAAVEGVGLRMALRHQFDVPGAITQIRLLAQRYLARPAA